VSDAGKKVGVVGALLAALGGAAAHGADDCARVGARGMAAEAVGVKAASNVGDDLARVGSRGVSGDLGRRALKAPLSPALADDVGRLGARGRGFDSELGFAALGEEAATGTRPWKAVAEELAQEVSVDALSELLEVGDVDGAPATPRPERARVGLRPVRVALVPAAAATRFAGYSLSPTTDAVLSAVVSSAPQPALVIGSLHPETPGALLMQPGGARLELSMLHARAAALRVTVWVVSCPRADLGCLEAGKRVIDDAMSTSPGDALELGRALVRASARSDNRLLAVHGVARAKGVPRLVHSRPRASQP
jgi:hypothetical protein